ncbi:MAG TPA: hypothetical protein PLR18_00370 [bacterium]|nr:hypothetical protein [bacterium]
MLAPSCLPAEVEGTWSLMIKLPKPTNFIKGGIPECRLYLYN